MSSGVFSTIKLTLSAAGNSLNLVKANKPGSASGSKTFSSIDPRESVETTLIPYFCGIALDMVDLPTLGGPPSK
jgi:hypothetical protein